MGINDLISGSLTQEDEDDVLAELDALTEDVGVELPSVPTAEPKDEDVQLPDVPENDPEQRKREKVKHERVALAAS